MSDKIPLYRRDVTRAVLSVLGLLCLAVATIFALKLYESSSKQSYPISTPFMRPTVSGAAFDFIRMEACRTQWNHYIDTTSNSKLSVSYMDAPSSAPFSLNGVDGQIFRYNSYALPEVDICGWYFIPNQAPATSAWPSNQAHDAEIWGAAQDAQIEAIVQGFGKFNETAAEILKQVPASNAVADASTSTPVAIALNKKAIEAASVYQSAVTELFNTLYNKYSLVDDGAKHALMAESMPITSPPLSGKISDADKPFRFWGWFPGQGIDEAWRFRQLVASDMAKIDNGKNE